MWNSLNKISNNIKIKPKLFTLYLSIIIVILLIIGLYLSPKISDFVRKNAIKETVYYNNTIKDRVKVALELAVSISDIAYYEERLHEVVTKDYDSPLDVYKAYDEYEMLDRYKIFSEKIDSIRLFVDNPTILTNSSIVKVTDNIKENDWYKKAIADKGLISWYYMKDCFTEKYNLSLVREIWTEKQGHIGVLVIGIGSNNLNNIIDNKYYKATIALDGIVIYSDELPKGSKINIEEGKEVSLYEDSNYQYEENEKYKVLDVFKINKSSQSSFQILGEVSLDLITKEPMRIISTTLGWSLVVIIISLIVTIFFINKFYERIDILKREMHQVVKKNFNIKKRIDGSDEISEIYDDLYIMMDSIKQLIDDVYVKELQQKQLIAKQKEIEFKMLSSQINPHFLYNTLETIRMRAFCSGDRELAIIVKKLGKLMRRSLEVSNENVLLESELDFIDDYLSIQGFRFTGKIEYKVNVNVDIKRYKILPLLLQPVIENAIIHGIESKKDKGRLTINVYEKSEFLIVEIIDNGSGITPEKLDAINKRLENATNTELNENKNKSIGITNVNERIKIFYGEDYGLKIFSELNVGTQVLITLPKVN